MQETEEKRAKGGGALRKSGGKALSGRIIYLCQGGLYIFFKHHLPLCLLLLAENCTGSPEGSANEMVDMVCKAISSSTGWIWEFI